MDDSFRHTILESLHSDIHNLINSTIVEHGLYEKKIKCYDPHHLLGLKCQIACKYCGRNTNLWPCHPYCIDCICDRPPPPCVTCAKFQIVQKDQIEKFNKCLDWNKPDADHEIYVNGLYDPDGYEMVGWPDKSKADPKIYIKGLLSPNRFKVVDCPLCYSFVIPNGSYPGNHFRELCGIFITNCSKCNVYGYTRAVRNQSTLFSVPLLFPDITDVRNTCICLSCLGKCQVCHSGGNDPLQKVTHETYFGPKKFSVCKSCIEIYKTTIFDKSITTIL